MQDRETAAGRSTLAGSHKGQDKHGDHVGKSTRVEAEAARVPPDPNSVPDLATSTTLRRELETTYLKGPKGTIIEAQLSARISGGTHTHGSASVGGQITTENGKPQGDVSYTFRNHDFKITLTGDGKMKAETGVSGEWHDMKFTTKIVSKGNDLSIHLDGQIHIPGPHGSLTTLGVGITLDLRAIQKPPRGVEPEPDPVTIPLKVLIPTVEVTAGGALILTIAKGILEGIGAELIG